MILLGSTIYLAASPAPAPHNQSVTVTVSSGHLSPETSSVVVAESGDTYSGTGPVEMGIEQGIFRSLGLNVTWVATVNAVQALQAGQVQFAIAGPPFQADAAGGTLVAVGQLLPNVPAAIIASPSIASLAQLDGKTFGCTSSGSLTCVMAYLLMKSQNWTASLDLIKPLGQPSAQIAALERGDIQAMIYNWGTALQLQQSGKANILGDIRTYVPSWYSGCILVNKGFAAANPNTVRLFLAGIYRSNAWIAQNPGPTEAWIQSHYGVDTKLAQVLYNTTEFSLIGTMQPSELRFMYNATAEAYGLPAVDIDTTFTNEYAPVLEYSPGT